MLPILSSLATIISLNPTTSEASIVLSFLSISIQLPIGAYPPVFFVGQFVHPVNLPVESINVRADLSVDEKSDHLANSTAEFLLFLCCLGRVTPSPVDKTQANHAQYRET